MSGEGNGEIKEVLYYLSLLSRLYAYDLVNKPEWDDKSNGEKIILLYKLGFSNEDIASIIGTTLNTVRKEISVRKDD